MSELTTPEPKTDILSRPLLASVNIDWEKAAYLLILLAAIVTRFWGLGDRVMSHDESLHTQFSYQFFIGDGFSHTPLMHGPFLFHITPIFYWLFGDNDFSARVPVAIFGIILVAMPYFLRPWLGKIGGLVTSFLFLISPYLTYYSRYIRHDIYVIVWAMIIFIAIWYYFQTKEDKYLWWFAAGNALMFATKEVSFIYVAIFGSFLVIRLLPQVWMAPWLRNNLNKLTSPVLLALLGLLMVSGGLLAEQFIAEQETPTLTEETGVFAADPVEDAVVATSGEEASAVETRLGWVEIIGIIAFSAGLFWMAARFRPFLKNYAEFDLIVLFTTLILPMASPLFVVLAGGNPLDYTNQMNGCLVAGQESMTAVQIFFARIFDLACWGSFVNSSLFLTALFLIITLAAAVLVGLWWDQRRWVIAALIYHAIFFVLYTSVFTNIGAGWTSGTIGSLGYWLEQQEVQRGNQPAFYYFFVVPFYEFLPLIFSLLAIRFWLLKQKINQITGYWFTAVLLALLGYSLGNWVFNLENVLSGLAISRLPGILIGILILGIAILVWFFIRRGQILRAHGLEKGLTGLLSREIMCDFVAFVSWWLMLTWTAYSVAGEKMPWLSTHFVIPMGLLAGWYINERFKEFEWRELFSRQALLFAGLTLGLIVAVFVALGPVLLGRVQFGNQQLGNLTQLGQLLGGIVLAAIVFWFWQQVREEVNGRLRRPLVILSLFTLLSLLTIRFTYLSSWPNADYAREFMVYAHGAPAAKSMVLDQIETLSTRMHGDKSLRVAFGGSGVSWPFTWYMREYPNRVYFGESPSATLNESPVVIVGRSNWDEVDRLLGNNYTYRTYTYLWWPMEEYRNIGWAAILGDPNRPEGVERRGLLNPNVREALWDIFFYRDFTTYSQVFGGTLTDGQWPLRDDLRLYVRKDVLVDLWDYGLETVGAPGLEVPYEEGEIQVVPELVINPSGIAGAADDQLFAPRNVVVGEDGRIYVLDSGNQRVQIFDAAGQFLDSFGGPGAGNGQFNPEGQGPWGLAIDEQFVYVADTWNHRVQKFTLDGQFVGSYGRPGNTIDDPSGQGLGLFFGPRDIAIVDGDRVLVTDTGHHRIQVMDAQGNFIGQLGAGNDQFGAALGQFYEPVGVATGPDGFVYVADTWNGRIQQLTADLIPMNEWLLDTGWPANTSVNNKPYLAVDSGGRVYVTDPESPRVLIFDQTGNYVGKFGQFGTDSNSFNLLNGIFIDQQDNIYVVDAGNNRVLKYPPIFAPVVPIEVPIEEPIDEEPADAVEEEDVLEDAEEEPIDENEPAAEPTEPPADESEN
ncbi:flippase activity-associated protein Agl23 [Candidatus Leptofilum sp.]|uniref:flippase activity-associated protein Agl23 n=1 Tax=Candidatus Leptofilum sp. TaxID=3241576 RepID=UPI003B590BF7